MVYSWAILGTDLTESVDIRIGKPWRGRVLVFFE